MAVLRTPSSSFMSTASRRDHPGRSCFSASSVGSRFRGFFLTGISTRSFSKVETLNLYSSGFLAMVYSELTVDFLGQFRKSGVDLAPDCGVVG